VLVDGLERLGFDSLWLSEPPHRGCAGASGRPAFAAGRTQRLKLGTSVLVLPGRNPVVLAKELASLDRLSDGSCCWRSVRRVRRARASGVRDQQPRPSALDGRSASAAPPPLDRGRVTHHGPRFQFEELTVLPRPIQQPIDIWLGGLAPAALRRLGRIADGWLPSTITPAEAARAAPSSRNRPPLPTGSSIPSTSARWSSMRAMPSARPGKNACHPSPGHRSFASRPGWSSAIRDTVGAFVEAASRSSYSGQPKSPMTGRRSSKSWLHLIGRRARSHRQHMLW